MVLKTMFRLYIASRKLETTYYLKLKVVFLDVPLNLTLRETNIWMALKKYILFQYTVAYIAN
jgi:hypothetical protein